MDMYQWKILDEAVLPPTQNKSQFLFPSNPYKKLFLFIFSSPQSIQKHEDGVLSKITGGKKRGLHFIVFFSY